MFRWAECQLRGSPNHSLECERGCRAEAGLDFCREGDWEFGKTGVGKSRGRAAVPNPSLETGGA